MNPGVREDGLPKTQPKVDERDEWPRARSQPEPRVVAPVREVVVRQTAIGAVLARIRNRTKGVL